MNTDEYEISIGREISLCRRFVKKLGNLLHKREKQYGMTTEAFLRAMEEGRLSEQIHFRVWREEYRDLRYWQKLLNHARRRGLKGEGTPSRSLKDRRAGTARDGLMTGGEKSYAKPVQKNEQDDPKANTPPDQLLFHWQKGLIFHLFHFSRQLGAAGRFLLLHHCILLMICQAASDAPSFA